jgi:S-adenosylmethionine:tRNA ribosyltransferase-isomerase
MTKTSDFDYHLPERMIAQTPIEPRDASRLLVLHRHSGQMDHRAFRDISAYLLEGDLLVLNQTRVIPARLFAHKPSGGRVELLLLRKRNELTWTVLVGGKGMSPGKQLLVDGGFHAEVTADLGGSERVVTFSEPIEPFLPLVGHVPLPPYIHGELGDPDRYQTVYARDPGSAAAPTAGLHFTPDLMMQLQAQGIALAYVTLHVGLDTFAPVNEAEAEKHAIHTEWCDLSLETAALINKTHADGGRVVAVGTTSVRTLESAARHAESLRLPGITAYSGDTDLYILPGFRFKTVDVLVTNFHLPKSTLLMLVSAFAGRERVLEAYDEAKRQGYRFYSFGDAMLIV